MTTETGTITVEIPLYSWKSKVFGSGSWAPLQPWPTSSKSHSRTASTSNKSKRNSLASGSSTLKIATWNVWFDGTLQDLRARELLKILAAEDADVICLQEITTPFQRILASNTFAQFNWVTTSLGDEASLTQSRYGTIILVRKSLITERGWSAGVTFTPFTATECGRGLSLLKLVAPDSPQPILVGNVHFELGTSFRSQQFGYCNSILTSPSHNARLSILCGDTNIFAYSELENAFLQHGFIDTLLQANPLAPNLEKTLPPEEKLFRMPTFGQAGLKWVGKPSKERVARLDYVLARPGLSTSTSLSEGGEAENTSSNSFPAEGKFIVKSGKVVGGTQIPNEVVKKEAGVDDPEMKVWLSDYCGVVVEVGGF